jgi:hypothetical protein
MKFFRDTLKAKHFIKEAIDAFGFASEHNAYWYEHARKRTEENVFVRFPNGMGILTTEVGAKREAYVFSSPLAPQDERVPLLLSYIDYILNKKKVDRVEMELEDYDCKQVRRDLPSSLRARRPMATLISPVMDLSSFDGSLSGRRFKSIRHARNRFYRDHAVESVDARLIKQDDMRPIIDKWKKMRRARDHVACDQYYNLVRAQFDGIEQARVLIVDGRPVGFNAGWMIPNSRRFYAAVGVHDYSLPDLGQILYLEDLLFLKNRGIAEADMGGSDERLLAFKNQFYPLSSYRTRFFSVVRNEVKVR